MPPEKGIMPGRPVLDIDHRCSVICGLGTVPLAVLFTHLCSIVSVARTSVAIFHNNLPSYSHI